MDIVEIGRSYENRPLLLVKVRLVLIIFNCKKCHFISLMKEINYIMKHLFFISRLLKTS